MALQMGWAYKDPATKLIDWQTFQLTAPTLTQAPTYTQVTRETVCQCSEDCGDFIVQAGTEAFPESYIIDLTENQGIVSLLYNAVSAPTKFILEYGGIEIFNSGYKGDPGRQAELDLFLYTHGLPLETITGPTMGTYSFPKSTDFPDSAIVRVYSPLYNYGYYFSLGCPFVSTTTTTSTSTSTSSSTTSTTTTTPPSLRRTLVWEFDNPSSLGVKLISVTVEDSEGTKLWDNELIDLTLALSEQRSQLNALPDYNFIMTSASDEDVEYEIWISEDGGAESLLVAAQPFDIGDINGGTFGNQTSTTSIKYIIRFV